MICCILRDAHLQKVKYSGVRLSFYTYYISPIEVRSLWTKMKYVRSAARLLNRNCVNKRGLDLSREVLWVSIGQWATDLQAVKVGGQKKILPISPARAIRVRTGAIGRIFFLPPTLTACKTAALWPTETHSTSLERSKSPLLTQSMFKSLAALLTYFFSVQSDLISIELTDRSNENSTPTNKYYWNEGFLNGDEIY